MTRTRIRLAGWSAFLLCCVTPVRAGPGQASKASTVRVENTYEQTPGGLYRWRIFINEDPTTLAKIGCVQYTLHPSFAKPEQRICKKEGGFELVEAGNAEFPILVKVEWKDKTTTTLTHRLNLGLERTSGSRPALASIQTGNHSTYLGEGQWSWTVFITADPTTLGRIRCVEYKLHPTFPHPIQNICSPGTQKEAFPLTAAGWGTFEIGVKILFSDGSTRLLSHQLAFGKGTCDAVESFRLEQRSLKRFEKAEFGGRLHVYVGDIHAYKAFELTVFEDDHENWQPFEKIKESRFAERIASVALGKRHAFSVRALNDSVSFDFAGQRYALRVIKIEAPWIGSDYLTIEVCKKQ